MEKMFSKEGYYVITAADGPTGRNMAVQFQPDLILLDIMMPGEDGFEVIDILKHDPKTASRPWDIDREGFVIGEGSGVMVLEEYEHAKKRGAKIYCELIGYGMSADAYHITAPSIDGPKRSMLNALNDAELNVDEIQYINAHGTSTPLGDLNETNAIKETFGESAYKLVVKILGH